MIPRPSVRSQQMLTQERVPRWQPRGSDLSNKPIFISEIPQPKCGCGTFTDGGSPWAECSLPVSVKAAHWQPKSPGEFWNSRSFSLLPLGFDARGKPRTPEGSSNSCFAQMGRRAPFWYYQFVCFHSSALHIALPVLPPCPHAPSHGQHNGSRDISSVGWRLRFVLHRVCA